MARFRLRSLEGRIFFAVLLAVLLPIGLALGGGLLTLRGIGNVSGTLGAWDAVAGTGRALTDSLAAAGVDDPAVTRAAARHSAALSESVRLSRLYGFVARLFLTVLPLATLATGLLAALLAWVAARVLARSFGRPVAELAGWTQRIARAEPLPPAREGSAGIAEIDVLADALRRMDAELAAARERDLEAARLRSWTDLARTVAHELKNPLTPMRMAVASLGRSGSPADAEATRVLDDELRRLEEMARTFARYGRMPEGPRSDVDLAELLQSLADQHSSGAVDVRVEAEPVMVHGHFDALERLFRNLVVNAVEAVEGAERPTAGPPVLITLRREDGEAVVEVADRGPGIPESMLTRIWNPDTTTKRRGTGLGLALVRRTVLDHGGEVEARNRPDGGAAFRVRLPERGT